MKKSFNFLVLFMTLFFVKITTLAETNYQVKLTANSVRFRSGASTSSSIITSLAQGSSYPLVNLEKYADDGGCSEGWYKIMVGTTEGYVCSLYTEVIQVEENTTGVATSECEKEMQAKGFPYSYWGKLCALKQAHPSWIFEALNTNLDWQSAVNAESACDLSYIYTTDSEYIDSSCVSKYSASSNWKPASQKAVAYYLDPRNFLTERYIFQFEYLHYNSNLSSVYKEGSAYILRNASVYNYHKDNGVYLNEIIDSAGSTTNVHPIFLSSRMLQELGSGTSEYDLYSGIYTGYDNAYYGFYNFFNIGVSDACATSNGVAYCGLNYAKNKGWDSPLSAISGASTIIADEYIAVGQYTDYLQKFNLVPTNISKLYVHQYMTNIAAPASEASSAYNTYSALNMLDASFLFYIPVFNNMDSTINNVDSGASNDNVDNSSVSTLSINTIVTSSGYGYTSKYLTNVKTNSDAAQIISDIEAVAGSGRVTIKDLNDNSITSGIVGTGFKIIISNNSTSEILSIVVKGDTSGDGIINALDLLQVQKYILGNYDLANEYAQAGDTSGDGTVNALDLLQIQKYILGIYSLN